MELTEPTVAHEAASHGMPDPVPSTSFPADKLCRVFLHCGSAGGGFKFDS